MTQGDAGPVEVTIVANDVGPIGGMERQLTQLISGLLERGHQVTVISWTCELPEHAALRWIRVPRPSRPFMVAYPWFVLVASLLVWLRGRGLVHSTGAVILGRASVCSVHYCHHAVDGSSTFSRASRSNIAYRVNAHLARHLSRLGERWCYRPRRVGKLVGVSEGVARELRREFSAMESRIVVVPNGVDTASFSPSPHRDADGEGLNLVFVGSEWERKGLHIAIEALAGNPVASLTVVGDGDVEAYGKRARELGVESQVHFVGATADVSRWYRRADALLLPTAYETFSLVAYEAAASGLPLLVTKVNGVEDLLQDGLNGWFIDRDPKRTAGRIRELQSNPELRAAMGIRAREDSLRFTWSRMVDGYEDVYATESPARTDTRSDSLDQT